MQRSKSVTKHASSSAMAGNRSGRPVRLKPLALAIALLLQAGGAQAQQPFSGAWFAGKGANQGAAASSGRLPNGQPIIATDNKQAQQQKAHAQLQSSLNNLQLAARAIAVQQAAQQAARQAAIATGSKVPEGLAEGGLKVDSNSLTAGWFNANGPTQVQADGKTVVSVKQTADKAILNWETLNIGQNTTLQFDQLANWSVLNRVNDPLARPSQVRGQIKADGTVMLVNRNGIVFTGSSQVDTRSLVAAAVGMSDSQFKKGIYSETLGSGFKPTLANDLVLNGSVATHANATADVVVQAGAQISTRKPQTVTEGGGYVLLAGREVHNGGSLSAPNGQVMLAAGDSFVIRKGLGTDANRTSSTRGNEVDVKFNAQSGAGKVTNAGLVQALTGDVTLTGRDVQQAGVLLGSTSVTTRGTVHLKADGSEGLVTLAPDSLTTVLLDDSGATALDVQRDALIKDSALLSDGAYNRRDLSLIQIASGRDIAFDTGSLTLATGGQVNALATRRTQVARGASIDVSGAVGVNVAMASNNVLINVQGNEQRDAPGNRDSKALNNTDLWVDRRDLVRVAAGTNGYPTDRWYTGGGLLEVSGYLNTGGHGIGEWAAQGGTVAFKGGELVTQAGSSLNVSGGTFDVQTGMIRQSWLSGKDGQLYKLSTAPGDMLYSGLYRGFESQHKRWGDGATENFANPLIGARERLENGYTVGRDAGRVIVGTGSSVLEGGIESSVFQGERQKAARDATLDSYRQSQLAAPRKGELLLGQIVPVFDAASAQLRDNPTALLQSLHVGMAGASGVAAPGLPDAMPESLVGKAFLDAGWLNAQQLGGFKAYATGDIAIDAAVQVAPGGEIALHAPEVQVNAGLSARGGSIVLGDIVNKLASGGNGWLDTIVAPAPQGHAAGIQVAPGVTLDTRGLWSQLQLDPADISGLPYVNGGKVSLLSSGAVTLAAGSVIDTSSGAAMLANGKLQGGRGGNITLKSNQNDVDGKGSAALVMDGELRGYGVKGGGTLSIDSGIGVALGGGVLADNGILPAGQSVPVHLTLAEAFTIKAGTVLDSDFHYVSERLAPGQVLLDLPDFSVSRPYTLAAAWVVPPASVSYEYIYIGATNGNTYMSGMTVPAGVTLNRVQGKLGSGYLVPAAAFPNGMPVAAYSATVAAGTAFAADVTLNAGERLLAGNRVPQDLAIKPLLVLDSSLFQRGFAHYDITGQQGVQVAQGAAIDVAMPVLRADPALARTLASGADPAAALQPWLAPLWQEDAVKGVLTQRAGADIALAAGTRSAKAPLVIGKDAALRVDEGQSISLTGNGQITVEGKLSAAGGRISVLPGVLVTGGEINRPDGSANAQSIWIGDGAVLDVAGRAATAIDAQGGIYGHVGRGGSIEIGARHKLDAAQVEAADAFVVLRPGARLEASGAAARLDLPGQGSVLVAGDGGSIALSSFRGLFLDGSLHAAAGGAGAAGGTLALNLETPNYGIVGKIDLKGLGVEDAVRVPHELVLSRQQGDSGLASGLAAGDRDPALRYGVARLGVDRIEAGGFDHLALLANGLLSFDGDVDLSLGQSLRLTATSLALGERAGATSQVRLAAPYIHLAGTTRTQADDHLLPNPVNGSGNGGGGGGKLGTPAVANAARLTLDAGLIDLANTVNFGANGSIVQNVAQDLEVKRDAFGQLELRSSGDIRMRGDATLYTPGNLTLAGAQIYPVSGAKGRVLVGQQTVLNEYGQMVRQFDPTRSLTIERTGDPSAPLPAMPYSVFGSLELGAATVNQGGVLRAPLGKVTVGMNGSGAMTSQLNLLPGSVTSVSANGLVMPYGGTLDGLSYMYDGDDVAYKGVGNDPAIVLAGKSVDVRNGAVLDMTGGGSLTGAAFLAGRGGSTDARLNPLVQTLAKGGFVLPGLATNPVYAIVPGAQAAYAPVVAENGAGDPALGRQISIGAGVPGLAAGTYTLLPSSFALLPGAFRVELNGLAAGGMPMGSATAMRNGSYAAAVQLGISNTRQRDVLSSQALLTSADVLRSYSQFNETSYADFALAQAVRDGVPRPLLERDAKALHFDLVAPVFSGSPAVSDALRFAGQAQYTPGKDGFGGSALLLGGYLRNYEILGSGAAPTAGFEGTAVRVDALNAIAAPRLGIGGLPTVNYNDPFTGRQQANVAQFQGGAGTVVLRDGAVLRAGEVFLVTDTKAGGIIIEQGGGINTLGRGAAAWDSSNGFVYAPGTSSVLAVSNGRLDMLAPTFSQDPRNGPGRIDIGACAPGATCSGATPLYSEGTIAAATDQSFNLRDATRYGTRNLVLAVGGINVGSDASLAAMAARDMLPAGLTLNQGILDRLLHGDASAGAPALDNLVLTARDAINFYDNVELSTIDAVSGKSSLERLVIGTPAIYGAGGSDAVARIRTDVLVWNGAKTAAGLPAAEGAGSGKGRLQIDARQVEFGYGPNSRPDTIHSMDRLILGFGDVAINAAERITANHTGSLSVYQSQSGWDTASKGYLRSGGNLSLNTALLTGSAGSVNKIKAGGDILVARPSTAKDAPQDPATLAGALGAEIALDGRGVTLDTAVLLPSGKLSVSAEHDVLLGDAARLDLAGRKIAFHDVSKYSWGGEVVLDSRGGDVRQAAGSRIDISAVSNRAGKLTATALGQEAGTVALLGGIAGGSSGHYDAGGTEVPFAAGGADIRGQHIADFGGLNQRLTDGGVVGSRSFQLKQGDLVLGNELRAREINVSVDAGHLTVKGTIDASGEQVGSIRLAARDGVSVAGSAVLDAHGSVLRVDSYGQVIEAPNRAVIDIDAGSGRLVLDSGARMDLRAGTAGKVQSLGTLELSAQRLGGARGNDVAIDAAGPLAIDGARAITVNGFWSYTDASPGTDATADGRPYQVIDQAYLERKHDDSLAFMNGALANDALMHGRLSGLRNYQDAFHLRPGVAILSATPDGDLHVDGDIDLSGYRYASVNPHTGQTGVRGSGEAGALVLRAGGKLNIFGSLNDGFDGAALPVTPDDNGWVLAKGRVPFGADVIVPHDQLVTLADDTFFQSGRTLNYDLPMKAMGLRADTALPVQATLTADLQLPAGTVLGGAVRNAAGAVVYAAGTVLASNVTLSTGMRLDAGSRLPVPMQVAAMSWPGGVPLPFPIGPVTDTPGPDYDGDGVPDSPANGVVLAGALTLRKGALVPSETWVRLPDGADMVKLRPGDAAGNQGRNWALAPMLASGSQSWSMRLVGGADTQAADTRALRPGAPDAGLLLSDHHYGMGHAYDLPAVAVPPTPGVAGNFYWMGQSELYIGRAPGVKIDLDEWGGEQEVLNINGWGYGDLVTWLPEGASFPVVPKPARQQLFSVLRTGTGDLELLAGGNFSQSSPYGVYTAGTQAAGVGAAYRQARATDRLGSILGPDGDAFKPYVDGGAQNLYQAWYPEHGGNVLVRAQGDVTGDLVGNSNQRRQDDLGYMRPQLDSTGVGNWLWRQGTGSAVAQADGVPTAWWINFGSYVAGGSGSNYLFETLPVMTGFTGIGTLGGGNLVLEAGGGAGMLSPRADQSGRYVARSQGLNLVVASTGRVAPDGSALTLTGGGDLDIRIGGGLNPVAEVRSFATPTGEVTPQTRYQGSRSDLNSTFVNLRGAMRMAAGSVGGIELRFDKGDNQESRAYQVYTATSSIGGGGPVLVPGDAGVRIDTRGDLVLGGVGDAGRVTQVNNGTPFTAQGVAHDGEGYSWFSLWTPSTAIDLFSAGGNLTPSTAWTDDRATSNQASAGGRFVLPSQLRAVAASGSLYYGNSSLGGMDGSSAPVRPAEGLLLAPSPVSPHFTRSTPGQLELLASDSIYAGGYAVTASGADPTTLPSPFNPGFAGVSGVVVYGDMYTHNVSQNAQAPSVLFVSRDAGASPQRYPLFTFAPPTASGYAVQGQLPARYYAVAGDLVGLRTGSIISRGNGTWYEGGGPVALRAGRDIVNSGTALGLVDSAPEGLLGWSSEVAYNNPALPLRPTLTVNGSARGNLLVHNNPDDVSVVSAGRDLRYSTFYVAGPGTLEVTAGRDIYMADKAELKSIGPVANVTPGDRSSGAGIVVATGVGAHGPDYAAFAARYLDPAKLSEPGKSLAEQPGKTVAVYSGRLGMSDWLRAEFGYSGDEAGAPAFLATRQSELDKTSQATSSAARRDLQREYGLSSQLHLVNWLETRYGAGQRNGLGLRFDAASMDARKFFAALPAEQQRVFLRNVYFAELKAGGREYTAAGGVREGSYLRGREAIATLFPSKDAQGKPVTYAGDLTMFSGATYYLDGSEGGSTKRPRKGINYLTREQYVLQGLTHAPVFDLVDAGIHTDFGGNIDILAPGGRTLVGVDGGFVPGEGSGVLTQGAGEIQIYARDSILLGQSRIFTTFGGNILAWSAQGDINAGRGSKSTVVFTPQRRVYDDIGLVSLSPTTPNTGAGIATLNPIPEVPPGDIDLIAPLGTIDAGEAGIRVSGNVNLAALQVVNAENIQVQGKSTGMPVIAAVNVGALSNASAAASQAVTAAQDVLQRERAATRQALPSLFTVKVLGFGNEQADEGGVGKHKGGEPQASNYQPAGVVQVLGAGPLTAPQLQALTPNERRGLQP